MPKRHWPCFREWLRKPEFRFTAMSPIYIWRGQAALIICVRYCRSMDHSRPPKPPWKPLSLENFWTTTIGTWLMFSCRYLTIQFREHGWMRKVLVIRIAKLIGTHVHWPTICEFRINLWAERDVFEKELIGNIHPMDDWDDFEEKRKERYYIEEESHCDSCTFYVKLWITIKYLQIWEYFLNNT